MTIRDEILLDSPTSYWEFNETSGSTVTSTTSAATMTVVNTLTRDNSGPADTRAVTSVGNGYLTSNYADIFANANWTIEFWFKVPTSPAPAGGGGFSNFMRRDGNGRAMLVRYRNTEEAGGVQPKKFETYSNARARNSGVDINDGQWHHYVLTRTGANTAVDYLDGNANWFTVENGTLNLGALGTSIPLTFLAEPTAIGIATGISMSNIAIYDTKALSAARVEAHFISGGAPVVTVSPAVTFNDAGAKLAINTPRTFTVDMRPYAEYTLADDFDIIMCNPDNIDYNASQPRIRRGTGTTVLASMQNWGKISCHTFTIPKAELVMGQLNTFNIVSVTSTPNVGGNTAAESYRPKSSVQVSPPSPDAIVNADTMLSTGEMLEATGKGDRAIMTSKFPITSYVTIHENNPNSQTVGGSTLTLRSTAGQQTKIYIKADFGEPLDIIGGEYNANVKLTFKSATSSGGAASSMAFRTYRLSDSTSPTTSTTWNNRPSLTGTSSLTGFESVPGAKYSISLSDRKFSSAAGVANYVLEPYSASGSFTSDWTVPANWEIEVTHYAPPPKDVTVNADLMTGSAQMLSASAATEQNVTVNPDILLGSAVSFMPTVSAQMHVYFNAETLYGSGAMLEPTLPNVMVEADTALSNALAFDATAFAGTGIEVPVDEVMLGSAESFMPEFSNKTPITIHADVASGSAKMPSPRVNGIDLSLTDDRLYVHLWVNDSLV